MDFSIFEILALIVGAGLILLGGVGEFAGSRAKVKDPAELRRSRGIFAAGVVLCVGAILL